MNNNFKLSMLKEQQRQTSVMLIVTVQSVYSHLFKSVS
jgi:hypothetical protein